MAAGANFVVMTGHGYPPHIHMRLEDIDKPTVPVAYAMLMVDVARRHGVEPEALLAAAGIPSRAVEDPAGRLSVLQTGRLLDRAVTLSGEPALGYEVGLLSSLTSHGLIGYGLMSSPTLRAAIELGAEFLQTRVPVLTIELFTDGDYAVIQAVENVPLGRTRQSLYNLFLVGLARMAPVLTDHRIGADDIELWFDCPEPDYYERFRARLPTTRFDMGANQTRFRAAFLDRQPDTANPVTVAMIKEQCRIELEQLGLSADTAGQVRAVLQSTVGGYPDLATVAELLNTSSRTLKRRLQEQGTTFQQITDSVRKVEAIRLVSATQLTAEQIAARLGYADARSFRRAFQTWTDTTPRVYRDKTSSTPTISARRAQ